MQISVWFHTPSQHLHQFCFRSAIAIIVTAYSLIFSGLASSQDTFTREDAANSLHEAVSAIQEGGTSYQNLTVEDIDDFIDVVFFRDPRLGYLLERLHRWDTSIQVGFKGGNLTNAGPIIDNAVNLTLGAASSFLKIEQATTGYNLLIIFDPDIYGSAEGKYLSDLVTVIPGNSEAEALKFVETQRVTSSVCYSYSGIAENMAHTGGIIFVNSTLDEVKLSYCISRELLRVLGLSGLSSRKRSILSLTHLSPFPRKNDIYYLSLLYNADLELGMDREETRTAAKKLISGN